IARSKELVEVAKEVAKEWIGGDRRPPRDLKGRDVGDAPDGLSGNPREIRCTGRYRVGNGRRASRRQLSVGRQRTAFGARLGRGPQPARHNQTGTEPRDEQRAG